MTNTELKLESQLSTLPRAGRSGKSLPFAAATNVPSGNLSGQTDAAAVAGELSGISGKRRSAAHSYRMQTESSLAKMSAGKDSSAESSSSSRSSLNKKESYTMMRFPSTPDIVSQAQDVNSCVESTKHSQRPGCVDDAGGSQRLWTDGHFKVDNSGGTASVENRSDDASRPAVTSDCTLMPPPLSTSVPMSYQATFIAKAAKHRRTTMPESLARSRELLAGALAKHHRLSDSSAGVDDSNQQPSSLSTCRVAPASKQAHDPSPLEPPERDSHSAQNRVGGVQSSNISAHDESDVERTSVTDVKAEHSGNVSSAGSSATGSPKLVKIGRCVSPVRPRSASSTIHKRQLPADPYSPVPVTSVAADHTTDLDSATSSDVPQPSVMRSASSELGIRLFESAQNAAVPQSASASHLSSSSSAAVPVQHMSQMQQSLVPQQTTGKRPIASRTQTRLVLDSEHSNGEDRTCTAQQRIINEIENFCAESRLLADRAKDVEVCEVADHQDHSADDKPLVTSVGHVRQQWDKTKQVEPFIRESQSGSSVSQTSSVICDSSTQFHTRQQLDKTKQVEPFVLESKSQSMSSVSQTSSSVRCDSSNLADVSSLSRNSVNSVSSGSCLTYHMPTVVGSFSDSVISYGSAVQAPADASSVQQEPYIVSEEAKCDEANGDEEKSSLTPLRYTDSLGQPLSSTSSNK